QRQSHGRQAERLGEKAERYAGFGPKLRTKHAADACRCGGRPVPTRSPGEVIQRPVGSDPGESGPNMGRYSESGKSHQQIAQATPAGPTRRVADSTSDRGSGRQSG